MSFRLYHTVATTALLLVCLVVLMLPIQPCKAFSSHHYFHHPNLHQPQAFSRITPVLSMGYTSPESEPSPATKTKKAVLPKVGDMVRYFDIDGGQDDGQVLVGKISFITTDLGKDQSWTVELTELEDIGDGYYAEYPSRKRLSKKTTRNLANVGPIMASFVRAENAFKVPLNQQGRPQVRQEQYDLDEYQGPFGANGEDINQDVLAADEEIYSALKGTLLRNAAIAGAIGTLITDLLKGTEDAVIYAAGAIASVAYLFFLSVKTDTLGSQDAKLGKGVSNLRFLMPVLVIVGVAVYNLLRGDANPVAGSDNPFDRITKEQYAAAVLGFLTYRIPLFLTQLLEGLKDGSDDNNNDVTLPGSAGVAMQLAAAAQSESSSSSEILTGESLIPVLVVSGPQATGRSELVDQLLREDGRFVRPNPIDRVADGVTFERLQSRGEILDLDSSGRYGITKEGILTAAAAAAQDEAVVVVDANVELTKKLTKMSGARLIGVWIGLNSVAEFESRIAAMIDKGEIAIPEEETKESVIRARIREIVQEIEFGISSGIFEFTILNENTVDSLKQLREAAGYSFK
ncbi:expressed unknown protein [Seminavis robusta]|uniref:CGL160/ATPI domain-containing protein n=1 Tax=Seminavis robusta TaxID=568900 RepID=A0A9N8DPS9_9STRA|nr:expressed unknown protein [Seminavis robusta]|eukprot:Sro174_g076590.1 n/a (572) ;mRNA; r:26067-27782